MPILTAISHTHDDLTALLPVPAALVIVSGCTSINAVVKAELFPAGVRALGVGFPCALAVSIFGTTAPYVALWCKRHGIESAFSYYVSYYVSALICGSFLVYIFMADTRRPSLIDRD